MFVPGKLSQPGAIEKHASDKHGNLYITAIKSFIIQAPGVVALTGFSVAHNLSSVCFAYMLAW